VRSWAEARLVLAGVLRTLGAPSELGFGAEACEEAALPTRLRLSGLGLRGELPVRLCRLTSLTELQLACNGLTALPDALGELRGLTALLVGRNELVALPEALGRLARLRELQAFDNRLAALPDAITRLADLTLLNVSGNQLRALPGAVGELARLVVLFAVANPLGAGEARRVRASLPRCLVAC